MAGENHRPGQNKRRDHWSSNPRPHRGNGGGEPIHKAIPLYRELAASWNPLPGQLYLPEGVLSGDAHHGLYWERFFHGYTDDFKKLCEGDKKAHPPIAPAKSRFVFGFEGREVGHKDALQQAAERLRRLALALGGDWFDAVNDWRFATGLGQEHPTENGLAFHPTLGAPYLPGSGVKGLLRGYLEWLYGVQPGSETPAPLADQLMEWFGSPHKDPHQWPKDTDSRAGSFVFFDALPVELVRLRADVMTPHYGQWYEDGGKPEKLENLDPEVVPADWHSPNPVVFLVAEKIRLRFAVAPRPGLPVKEAKAARAALPKVMQELKKALSEFGAGAKTAVGYGLFGKATENCERKTP